MPLLPSDPIPPPPLSFRPKLSRFQLSTPHDTSVPNIVFANDNLPPETTAFNRSLLVLHEFLAQRVKIRVGIEAYISFAGKRAYKRLRGNCVLLSAPNARQAELFINAVLEFAASLDGKWLTDPPKPSEPTQNASK